MRNTKANTSKEQNLLFTTNGFQANRKPEPVNAPVL